MLDVILGADWSEVMTGVVKDICELKIFVPYGIFVGLLVGVVVFVIRRRFSKAFYAVLVAMYLSMILYRCFLNREFSENVVFDPHLGTTIQEVSNYHYFIDNILLFVPAGILLKLKSVPIWICMLTTVLMSILIETIQYATGLGSFHADDLAANTVGAIIGILIAVILDAGREIAHVERVFKEV